MSRSRRHTPIGAITTAASDKAFKAAEHRRARTAVRGALAQDIDPPGEKAFGNPWNGPKDGKTWFGPGSHDLLRK